jgi:hypothetical protein
VLWVAELDLAALNLRASIAQVDYALRSAE